MITDEQINIWRSVRGEGMVSSVGEYTPDEFWLVLDELVAERAKVAALTKDRDDCLAAREHYAGLYGEAVGQRDQLAGVLNRLITATSLSEYGMALSDARAALASAAPPPIKTPSPQ